MTPDTPLDEAAAHLTARAIHAPGICQECDAIRSVLKALSASQEPHKNRYEYRALIRRPWSILDPEEHRERGYMEEWTGGLRSKAEIQNIYEIRRSEETHAYVHRWERRALIEGAWEEDPDEKRAQEKLQLAKEATERDTAHDQALIVAHGDRAFDPVPWVCTRHSDERWPHRMDPSRWEPREYYVQAKNLYPAAVTR